MRPDWLKLVLLAGVLMLGTGASPEGVREADRLQREADIARSGGQWDIAYPRYLKLVQLFPETPHGKLAAVQAAEMREAVFTPDPSPDSEDWAAWTREIVDFFTWP